MNQTIYNLVALLKLWDWRLFAFILLFLGLPRVYDTYRVYLIGNEIPGTDALAIASQWQFVGLFTEVFQEATVLAIFFFLGKQLSRPAREQLDRIKTVLAFLLLVSLVIVLGVFFFREQFIDLVNTPESIRSETSSFLAISLFSTPFMLLSAAAIVMLEALNKRTLILIMVAVNLLSRFLFDSLLVGGLPFSLNGGTDGLAWSMLLSSAVVFVIAIGLLMASLRLPKRQLLTPPSFSDFRTYLRVGSWSGLDSLVRNLAYTFMILRLINSIGTDEIGGYYLFLQIFWGFLLVPILAFVDSARALFANSHTDIKRVRSLFNASILIVALFMLVWLALTPAWGWFAGVLNSDEGTLNVALTAFAILLVPYIMLAFNLVIDALFYGLGKTRYMAFQSILTNGTVYLVAFILYLTDVWVPTFESILLLFGMGIVVDSFLTGLFALKVLYWDDNESVANGALTEKHITRKGGDRNANE